MNPLAPVASAQLPALVAASGERAAWRFLEFFTAAIRNPYTPRAYARDVRVFMSWCTDAGIPLVQNVTTLHVATYIERLGWSHPAPAQPLSATSPPCAACSTISPPAASCPSIRPPPCAGRIRASNEARRRGSTDKAGQLLDAPVCMISEV
jgi:hypothetical protein